MNNFLVTFSGRNVSLCEVIGLKTMVWGRMHFSRTDSLPIASPLVFFHKSFKHVLKIYRKKNPIYNITLAFFDSLSNRTARTPVLLSCFACLHSQEYECDPVYGISPSHLAFNSKIFVMMFSILSP